MSNAEKAMDQVLAIMEKMAGNPNSQINAANVVQIMNQVTDTVIDGYKRVAELQTSTSLTAAEKPATVPQVATAQTETQEAAPVAQPAAGPVQTETATAEEAPAVAAAPKAAAKRTSSDSNTMRSTASKKAEGPKVEETVAQAPEPQPVLPVDEDTATAESMIREHGSAEAALKVLEENRKRGRKSAWHKIIEARADEERRAAPKKSGKVNAQALAEAIARGKTPEEASAEQTGYKFAHISRKPVMDPEKAIGATEITCLIDGVKRTMMSRYLKSEHHMTPKEYIAHFGLRDDYPMTTQGYRTEKRRLAEIQKLGKRKAEEAAAAPAQTPAASNRQIGRAHV